MRIGRSIGADGVHGQLRFAELERTLGRRDQHQHAFGARQVNAFKQRAGHRLLGRNAGAIGSGSDGGSHHGLAGLAHDGAHIFEVDVHMPRHIDDFSNAADGIFENIIGVRKRLILGDVVTQHFEQFLVQHHDQRIHIGFEFGQAAVGIAHAPATFKIKGLGDNTDRQNTHLACHASDHGRRAGAGATTHAGGDEQHVRTGNGRADVVHRQFGSVASLVGHAAGTQAAAAELDRLVRCAATQRLGVGIGANKFHALHRATNHVGDGVAAATTNTDDLDLGALVERYFFNHFDGHFFLLKFQNCLQLPNGVQICCCES